MLKNANYIYDNVVISDEVNTTKKFCKKAQVGVDLTVKKIYSIISSGRVDNKKTLLPSYYEIKPFNNLWNLSPHKTYIVELNEGVKLEKNFSALIIGRSSLNRCGVTIQSAVRDPGYTTKKGEEILTAGIRLTVDNDYGFELECNSRIAQIIVFENENTTLYDGQFNNGKNF